MYVKKDKLTNQDTIQTNSNVQKVKDIKSMVSFLAISNFNRGELGGN